MPKDVITKVRKMLIASILSTDLAVHKELMNRFTELAPKFDITNDDHRARMVQ
jgi:hypothetical protein